MSDKTIEQLAREVDQARESYESASQRESFARNETTTALNRLNAAQKALDTRIAEMRRTAPRDSDWARDRRPGVSVG